MPPDDNFPRNDKRSRNVNRRPQPKFDVRRAVRAVTWGAIGFFIIAILVVGAIFVWTSCRIEPQGDQIAILIRKTGANLKPDEIIATRPGQKGIQLEVLREGRYFYNPFTWDWQYADAIIVPSEKIGVVTRLYGKELPPGEIIAPEGYKGISADFLNAGKYFINPYAARVELFDRFEIKGGYVGVKVHLEGADPLHGDIPADMKNVYTVSEKVKGVQQNVLNPGRHDLHPYIYSVVIFNTQSQLFELQGDDAISFLSEDGFPIMVEGTLAYAVPPENAPRLTQQVGDMDDILKKIILPKVRSFSRIEGSKHPATDFIVGETRQEFQDSLEKHLVDQCARWGVEIRSVLVRKIIPPDEVSAIIREREVALQNQAKIEQQIEQARSQAALTRQEMLAEQHREQVESETLAIRARIQAEQEQSVKLTASQRQLDVAKIDAEAAKLQADAVLIRAEADRDVVAMHNAAEAAVTEAMSDAFGGGRNLARYTLYKKTAPLIQAIISTDREPGLGAIFSSFLPESPSRPASAVPAAGRGE